MNDHDLDTRLRDHGTSWREANQDRPGVDWDAVTGPRRSRTWLGVTGVSVAAAAIVVALVLALTGVFTRSTSPAHGTYPTPAMRGAPLNFDAISRNLVWNVDFPTTPGGDQPATSGSEGNGHPVALGVANDIKTGYVRTAYAAYDAANCRTTIERHHIGNGESSVGGFTISGHAAATPMAVSPDGTKLALAITPAHSNLGGARCQGSEQLAVINLKTHAVRRWSAVIKSGTLSSLQWAPDGGHLAFVAQYLPMISFRYQVLDTVAPGHDYELARVAALFPVSKAIFWWRGQLATVYKGAMHLVSGRDGVGKVIAKGFPSEVDSVSSDPTGDHLLMTAGDVTYRWDNGVLSRVKGNWTQPGW